MSSTGGVAIVPLVTSATERIFALVPPIRGRGGELAMTTAGGALVLLVLTGVVIWPWRQRRAKRGG